MLKAELAHTQTHTHTLYICLTYTFNLQTYLFVCLFTVCLFSLQCALSLFVVACTLMLQKARGPRDEHIRDAVFVSAWMYFLAMLMLGVFAWLLFASFLLCRHRAGRSNCDYVLFFWCREMRLCVTRASTKTETNKQTNSAESDKPTNKCTSKLHCRGEDHQLSHKLSQIVTNFHKLSQIFKKFHKRSPTVNDTPTVCRWLFVRYREAN